MRQVLDALSDRTSKWNERRQETEICIEHLQGMQYLREGETSKSVKALKYVVDVQEKTLDGSHPDRLASQHALAGAFQANGQVEDAVALLKHVVDVHKKDAR